MTVPHADQAVLVPIDEVARQFGIRAGTAPSRPWRQVVEARIETLRVRSGRLDAARAYLEHVLTFHQDAAPTAAPALRRSSGEARSKGTARARVWRRLRGGARMSGEVASYRGCEEVYEFVFAC